MSDPIVTTDFSQWRDQIEQCLARWLDHPGSDARLAEAMRYAVLGGGKRIRPILAMAAAQAAGANPGSALEPGCAVELIHAYSLVHDDLPAMDNDELRRGKPTVHIAFDEATAVLVGDALQTLAFEKLTCADTLPVATRLEMVRRLASASGGSGMAGGQAIDLSMVGRRPKLETLERMHRHKTGALIEASVMLGLLASGHAADSPIGLNLSRFGQSLGLAFQVQDDLLDVEGSTHTLGKPQGSDAARDKPTYPALLGLDGARDRLTELETTSRSALTDLGEGADALRGITDWLSRRRY